MLAVVTSYDIEELQEILPKLPPGPLDYYRQKATFDWRQMKICLEGKFEVLKVSCVQSWCLFYYKYSDYLNF